MAGGCCLRVVGHYVQGVAMDPEGAWSELVCACVRLGEGGSQRSVTRTGIYIATMSNDRSCRIFQSVGNVPIAQLVSPPPPSQQPSSAAVTDKPQSTGTLAEGERCCEYAAASGGTASCLSLLTFEWL